MPTAPRTPKTPAPETLTLSPIGFARTPFRDKQSAPRQPAAARGVAGTIELVDDARMVHALSDLDAWSHIWVIFWFHLNATGHDWKAKVAPPRSQKKRGVLSTRAPHRPNPLGLSVLRLSRIEGRVLHVLDVDLIDGTPVFDVKPYVAYTDSVQDAQSGWLGSHASHATPASAPIDPGPRIAVVFEARAREQLDWLATRAPISLESMIASTLAIGTAPHPYRRIRDMGDHRLLSVKDFRARFVVVDEVAHVLEIASGYRKRSLVDPEARPKADTPLSIHREFVERFGPRAIV